jgi:adenylate cyclase
VNGALRSGCLDGGIEPRQPLGRRALSDPGLRQRLAAILAADAAGYSRLMAADERATVAALDAARAVFRAGIEANAGRVVDMAGDSVLAVFESAAGAVSAALAVQHALARDTAPLPENRRLWFRIGVHLGDVTEKPDGTVYGDGVNVAARLQALATPGGVMVSDAVRGAVRGRVEARFQDLGEQPVKHAPHPVRAYAVEAAAATESRRATGPPPNGRVSIAVLCFDNMSADAEQDFFCEGIAEDIITDLSKINGITVIGRQSAFTYRGRANDLRRVGRELGVRYVLAGSARKAHNRVRVTAQLVEAETGFHVWANRYDRELDDMFLVGDEIAADIVESLDVKLARGEDARVWRKALKTPRGREVFNQGMSLYINSNPLDNSRARELFEEVTRLEPEAAQGYASAAVTHCVDLIHGWSLDPAASLADGRRLAARAAALDDHNPTAHYASSLIALFEGRHDAALAEGRRALELRPMCVAPRAGLALTQLYSGQLQSALQNARSAVAFNPVYPSWYLYLMAAAQYFGGQPAQALATLERVDPDLLAARVLRVAALSAARRGDEASVEARAIVRDEPGFSVERYAATQPFRDAAQRAAYLHTLRRAGLPG